MSWRTNESNRAPLSDTPLSHPAGAGAGSVWLAAIRTKTRQRSRGAAQPSLATACSERPSDDDQSAESRSCLIKRSAFRPLAADSRLRLARQRIVVAERSAAP